MSIDTHPAANLFPLMSDEELASMVEDMRAHGYDKGKPVLRYRGQVLDGRNRLRAAELAGVEPVFRDLLAVSDPYEESWRQNGSRRDLTPLQKADIIIKIKAGSSAWAAEQQRRREDANRARSEKAKAQHAVSNPRAGESSGGASAEAPPNASADPKDKHATAAALAREAGVSRATVERAQRRQREEASGERRPLREHERAFADLVEQASPLLERGDTVPEVAKALGTSLRRVQAARRRLGKGRKSRRDPFQRLAEAAQEYTDSLRDLLASTGAALGAITPQQTQTVTTALDGLIAGVCEIQEQLKRKAHNE